MIRRIVSYLKKRIPFGRAYKLNWFWTHALLVFVFKRWFRITVTAVVWKQFSDGSRAALVIEKQVSRELNGAPHFPTRYDLVKGGWRDEDDFPYEHLIEAMFRELKDESGITEEEVVRYRFEGIAFHPLTKYNRRRHRGSMGKLLVVLAVEVTPETKWRPGSEVKIINGFFTPTPQKYFKKNSAKRNLLAMLGWP